MSNRKRPSTLADRFRRFTPAEAAEVQRRAREEMRMAEPWPAVDDFDYWPAPVVRAERRKRVARVACVLILAGLVTAAVCAFVN